MMTDTNLALDGIHSPAWRVALLGRFREDARAMRVWSRQAPDSSRFPSVFVACSNGMHDLEGMVIGGRRDPDDAEEWDFSGTFVLYDEHGAILDVNGWLATDWDTVIHLAAEDK
ncbi:hypothetical protein [Kozakia baliensis]|uniref:hypothetical protein n=1 Tax=Kozakia baliensis TaxID=153496 RepID=UPI00087CCEBC|nr:hypothetical protein [Kozakia baliensis]AOX21616.1 hypothetical protein A0U90_14015 [Kozakia baliensis]